MACDRRNPLQRSGTHQDGRVPAALTPASFRLDDHSLPELLQFAARYAGKLSYWRTRTDLDVDAAGDPLPDNPLKDGDWSQFFASDPSAVLASASLIPVESYQGLAVALRHYVDDDAPRNGESIASRTSKREQHATLLFWLPVLLLGEVLAAGQRLSPQHHFSKLIAQSVQQNADSLIWLVRIYRGAISHNVIADAALDSAWFNFPAGSADGPLVPSAIAQAIGTATSALSAHTASGWHLTGFAEPRWADLFAAASPDPTAFVVQGPNIDLDGLQSLLRYNLFNRAYKRLLTLVKRLTAEALALLESSLQDNGHAPHYGLLVAFLRLFQGSQHELNQLTNRHLRYYYGDILRLPRQPGRADSVHLTVALKKNASPVLLPAGTRINAGKDQNGQPVSFSLDQDFVPNQARLVHVKALTVARIPGQPAIPIASPLNRSADGLGAALTDERPAWPPFGPPAAQARGRLGFALLDRRLLLREGTRTITVHLDAAQEIPDQPWTGAFRVFLSAEKDWLEATDISLHRDSAHRLVLQVTLSGGDPPIVGYNEKAHASGFATALPVLRVELALEGNQQAAALAAYQALRDTPLDSVSLMTHVEGVRNVQLQNDFGRIDPAKPFLPFGPMPEAGASLILGSSELFSKPLEWLTLDFEWDQPYSYNGFYVKAQRAAYTLTASHLSNGQWQSLDDKPQLFKSDPYSVGKVLIDKITDARIHRVLDNTRVLTEKPDANQAVFDIKATKSAPAAKPGQQNVDSLFSKDIVAMLAQADRRRVIKLDALDAVSDATEPTAKNPPYDAAARDGFVRLTLDKGFGFRQFSTERTRALMAEATGAFYVQSSDKNYDGGIEPAEGVYHPIWQFGHPKEPYLPRIMQFQVNYQTRMTPAQSFLELHPFGWRRGGEQLLPPTPFEGELYLGFTDLAPPCRVALLFRALEGTANPLKNPAALSWSCLHGDQWVDLDPGEISDSSYALSSTGIVSIAVPAGADTDHRLLDSGYFWIRVAAAQDADAVAHLLDVMPNAAVASRQLNPASPRWPSKSLPEGTISRLERAAGEVKSLTQPDASFDGRAAEQDETYYRRVAERLRHKDRAVSMWDYEHLVLQQFPEIYKVKCLNHTRLERDGDNHIVADNEARPGHVVIVPLPYVRAASDQRRPYARKRTLLQIGDFLRSRMTPFVRLEVQNPKVEEVQMQFAVAFRPGIDDVGFYLQQLNEDIVRYLTPWMFETGREIEFGGRWSKSTVIAFVERLDYIDYIKDVLMFHRRDIASALPADAADQDVVVASTARSILVSHANHQITPIQT